MQSMQCLLYVAETVSLADRGLCKSRDWRAQILGLVVWQFWLDSNISTYTTLLPVLSTVKAFLISFTS